MNLGKRGGEFGCRVIVDPGGEGGEDGGPVQPPHGDDERVAKARPIAVIQIGEAGEFIRCTAVEAGPCLLGAGLRRQAAGDGQLAGKFGMRAQQRHLARGSGGIDNVPHS